MKGTQLISVFVVFFFSLISCINRQIQTIQQGNQQTGPEDWTLQYEYVYEEDGKYEYELETVM